MAKTLKDLALALINATLILVALCLFLGWKLASKVESVSAEFSEAVQVLAPIRDEAKGIRAELSALREDLATLRNENQITDSQAAQNLQATLRRLNAVDQKLQTAQERFTELAETPEVLIAQAIQTGADIASERVLALKGCEPGS
ncbi:hypothetical protein LCM27_00885 [Ruegeria marisrubri]|uniref:hypothetical protein n=1 Tax=Ruegeria marisrubri TaxID=1685379 RepID=UPI001CD34752|nr:hypothetical protein [Ruegeria marisrubri]MCA0904943.1 hypothetical protein [Ruegeria marisrubri]